MHDINGAQLQVGDKVLIECEILSVSPDQDYCNCTLQTVRGMPGNGSKSQMTINTKQVGVAMRAVKPRYCKHCPFAEYLHSSETNAMNGCPGFEADASKV